MIPRLPLVVASPDRSAETRTTHISYSWEQHLPLTKGYDELALSRPEDCTVSLDIGPGTLDIGPGKFYTSAQDIKTPPRGRFDCKG
jgi:hypothetical protein